MRSLHELLDEAKWGRLTEREMSYLFRSLENHKAGCGKGDLYILLHTIRVARGFSSENMKKYSSFEEGYYSSKNKEGNLIETFLYYPKDVHISARALEILCRTWGYIEEFLDLVIFFINQEFNEKSEDIDPEIVLLHADYQLAQYKARENKNYINKHKKEYEEKELYRHFSPYVEPHVAINLAGNYLSQSGGLHETAFVTLLELFLTMLENPIVDQSTKDYIFDIVSKIEDIN